MFPGLAHITELPALRLHLDAPRSIQCPVTHIKCRERHTVALDSPKLQKVLEDVASGTLQLPDFQQRLEMGRSADPGTDRAGDR